MQMKTLIPYFLFLIIAVIPIIVKRKIKAPILVGLSALGSVLLLKQFSFFQELTIESFIASTIIISIFAFLYANRYFLNRRREN